MIHQKKGNIFLGIRAANIHGEGTLSQISSFVLVSILCEKTGNFSVIFLNIFSTFYIKKSNVFRKYQSCQVYNVNSKGDMHDQKIKVKKRNFG